MNIMTPSAADTAAAETISRALERPDLVIQSGDLPAAMRAMRALIAAKPGRIFDRGRPVRVITLPGEPVRIMPLSHHAICELAHDVCRPVTLDKEGMTKPATLHERIAKMYLDSGEWRLPPLDGVATSPLLSDDGTIRTAQGYDPQTRLWCDNVPSVRVDPHPSRADAAAALRLLRAAFSTFPYADGARITKFDLDVIDLDQPPGDAETALLAGLMTAICRPSLWLAPGLLITAPDISGAGSGKGLLVQAICQIAFGSPAVAFTTGGDRAELDKRIASELMQAGSALFLDNANSTALKSDTLASVITERPARVRVFGETRMVALNSTAWIAVTGNGLSVSEDLARRFLACELDPRCDDPEARDFPDGRDGFLAGIKARRGELLTAALTIWRWGRQNPEAMTKGKAFGSFETWAKWIRDPLLTLGCADPVEAIARAKARDPRRLRIAELFEAWWQAHDAYPVPAARLSENVRMIADPQGRGRQYLVATLNAYAGTRAGGFVMTRQESQGVWGHCSYALKRVEP